MSLLTVVCPGGLSVNTTVVITSILVGLPGVPGLQDELPPSMMSIDFTRGIAGLQQ